MHKDHKVLFELIIILVLVGFGLWGLKNYSPSVDNNNENVEVPVQSTSNNVNINNNNAAPSLSYAQALAVYKNARIQLDQICRASPNNVTYKNNTSIMIDNRAPVNRTVKVGSTFSISAYDFKIVKLSSSTLPAVWYIDCGNSQNVATILIQK